MNVAPPSTQSALAGMHDASQRLDLAAHNIANMNTEPAAQTAPTAPLRPDGTTDATDTPDRPTQMVAVATAPLVSAAHAQIVRANDRMLGSLLDVRA